MKTKLLLGLALVLSGYSCIASENVGFSPVTNAVPAQVILDDLKYQNVKNAYLLAFKSEVDNRPWNAVDALLAIEFTTNRWQLLHAFLDGHTRTWQEMYLIDASCAGRRNYANRPPKAEVDAFLEDSRWSFQTDAGWRLVFGEVYSNAWKKALGYMPGYEITEQILRPATNIIAGHTREANRRAKERSNGATNLDDLAAYKTYIPETIPHDACSTNMMQIAVALRIAIGESDRFPASLTTLTNVPFFNSSLLVCPLTGHVPGAISNAEAWTDYIYVGNGLEGGMCDVALLISPPENHGGKFGYVLWGCGNVTQLDASYVRALIKAPWCLPARVRGETFVREDGFDKFVKPTIKVRIPARFAGIYPGTTNSVEGTNSEEKIPEGYCGPIEVQQALQIYAKLAGADLKLQDGISTNHGLIIPGRYPAMTRAEAIAYLEKVLREQAGIIVVHKDAGHIELERQETPEKKR
jgi:hypothetical protein